MPSAQTRRKRRLGQYLLALRETAGSKHEEVAELLRKSQAAISKIENGYILCNFTELGAMLAFYGASDDQRREAQAMWDDAKADGKSVQVSAAHPRKYRAYVRSEVEAKSVRSLAVAAVPGLLQTAEYAAAVHAAARHFGGDRDSRRAVRARRDRQRRLEEPIPLELHALIDESALSRQVGGETVMRDQMRHLHAMTERDNVTLQVIPFEVGAYGALSGPMTILGFSDEDDPDAVYLEYPGGGSWVENASDVHVLVRTFEDVAAAALTPQESVTWLRARAE